MQIAPRETRIAKAEPLRKGHEVRFFQYLTVPSAKLADWQKRLFRETPAPLLQWRLEYPRPERALHFSDNQRRTLAVLEKCLARGHVTLLSPELEQLLRDPDTLCADIRPGQGDARSDEQDVTRIPECLDSPDEMRFIRLLPELLGADWERWVTPQVDHFCLVNEGDLDGRELRADFLIWHPALTQPVIVEIDGRQHGDAGAEKQDASRDEVLSEGGCIVVRLPVDQVRRRSGEALQTLEHILSPIKEWSSASRLLRLERQARSVFRRAGQIQMSLMQAARLGVLDIFGDQRMVVGTDLIEAGELSAGHFRMIVDDFADLATRVGRLYGEVVLPSGLQVLDGAGEASPAAAAHRLSLSFYGGQSEGTTLYVSDAYLPFHLGWQSMVAPPGSPYDWGEDDLAYFLNRLFRKPSFREGQYRSISRALRGQDTIVLLPTGAGKSLVFQLTSLLLPGRTIVVAPIISLIRDQVRGLSRNGIDRVLGFSSDMGPREVKDIAYGELTRGEHLFYYIAPERFQMEEFRRAARAMSINAPVSLIAIDEAHCVSEWGHDFRTAYLRIGATSRETTRRGPWTPPLLALTGTASRAVLKDLQRELNIMDYEAVITPETFDRPELHFHVLQCESADKETFLKACLSQTVPAALGVSSESLTPTGDGQTISGLVFCPHVNGSYGTVQVAHQVGSLGIRSHDYSGQPPKQFGGNHSQWAKRKMQVEDDFVNDRVAVLACTKAFGMGIDKPNVRFTIHYGMPPSIEAFYQEAGRAGRDRRDAYCYLLVSAENATARATLDAQTPVETVVETVNGIGWSEADDITRALFFHNNAFRGVDSELDVIRWVLAELSPADQGGRRHIVLEQRQPPEGGSIPTGMPNRAEVEKAIHRLVVIGVIADYTVDYAHDTFEVRLSGASKDEIIAAYRRYVLAYSGGRADVETQVSRDLKAQEREWTPFVEGIARRCLSFVYDVIENGRRRAISEMLAAAERGAAEGEDAFRNRFLSYLESTEYSQILDEMMGSPEGGVAKVPELVEQVVSSVEASSLRGQVSRYLESYPDQPALLLVRALSEAMCLDANLATVNENAAAFLRMATTRYAVAKHDLLEAVAFSVNRLWPFSQAAAHALLETTVEMGVSRQQARDLVLRMGLTKAGPIAWSLLGNMADEARQLIGTPPVRTGSNRLPSTTFA